MKLTIKSTPQLSGFEYLYNQFGGLLILIAGGALSFLITLFVVLSVSSLYAETEELKNSDQKV